MAIFIRRFFFFKADIKKLKLLIAQKSFNTSIMVSKIQEWISFKERVWAIPHYEWKPNKRNSIKLSAT